jgi:Dna[CI] antecedent DciA-like protein
MDWFIDSRPSRPHLGDRLKLTKIHDDPEPVAVVRAWCNAAGPGVSYAVFPCGYESGRLEVVVPDRAWLRELECRREELMRRLRRDKRMDQLREISLVLEPAPERPKVIVPLPPCESHALELSPEIVNAARAIADEDLSRRWIAAIARLLGVAHLNRPIR